MSRETFRRTLKEKKTPSSKTPSTKKREGEILHFAKSPVVTIVSTTPIYNAIQTMAEKGFRRIPIANPGTRVLEGIITSTDIIDYLGGGKKFEIIDNKLGGNIFKAVNEPVKQIMTKEVVAIKTHAKISDAIELMKESNVGGLPVVDQQNRVRAIITERDIANIFANKISGAKVSQIMSTNIVTAMPKTTIFEAEKSMISQGFRRLPIVSDGKLLGIITAMDIIRFFGSGKVFENLRSGTIIQVLNTPALEIATKEVATIEPHADVGQAAKIMREKNIGAIPVVENERLIGIVTERDFLRLIE